MTGADTSIAIALKFLDQATAPMNSALNQIRNNTAATQGAMESLTGSVGGLIANIGKIGASIITIQALRTAITELIQTSIQYETKQKSFQAISGGYAKGAAEMEFVRKEADRLRLDFLTLGDSYKTISAAAMGTNLQGTKTREIFSSVSEAARVLGLSNEQVSGTLLALGQMISKGKVQAEELRGQLGERLPGAFQIAARAMNMTTAELDKFMSEGKLTADVFLPKFAAQLHKTFGPEVQNAINQTQASLNKFTNTWNDFKNDFAEGSGVVEGFKAVVEQLTKMIKLLDEAPTRLRIFSEEWEKNDKRWTFFPGGGFFNAFGQANTSSGAVDALVKALESFPGAAQIAAKALGFNAPEPIPLRITSGQESYAGIGGGSEGPVTLSQDQLKSRLGYSSTYDEETRHLQDATAAAKAWSAANQEATAAVSAARTPLEIYNDDLSKYRTWLNQNIITQKQYNSLFQKSTETYQKALEKGTVTPLAVEDIARQLYRFEAKQKQILQNMAQEDDTYYANLYDRSGDYYKAEETRMWQQTAKRQDAYDKNVDAWAEMYRQMIAEVGKYQLVDPAVNEQLQNAKKMLDDLQSNRAARKAQIASQEEENFQWNVGVRGAQRAEDIASINLAYAELTGTVEEVYQAELNLVKAELAYKLAGNQAGEQVADAYRNLYREKERLLNLKLSGSFFDGLKQGLQDLRKDLTTASEDGRQFVKDLKSSIESEFSTFWSDFFSGEYADAADAASGLGKAVADAFATAFSNYLSKQLSRSFDSLFDVLGNLVGGLFGSSSGTTFTSASGVSWNSSMNFLEHHSGGIVGLTGGKVRPGDMSLLAGAPRLHSGLAADEYPAILQGGEEVISKSDRATILNELRSSKQQSGASSNSGGESVSVKVVNQGSSPVKASTANAKFDGKKWVLDVVLEDFSQGGSIWQMVRGGKG